MRAVRLPRAKPRRVSVLRAFAWPRLFSAARSACPPRRANAFGARAGDDDDLVLDSLHEVLLPSLYHSKAPSLIAERARFVEHARGEVVVQFQTVPLPKFGSSVTCFPFS